MDISQLKRLGEELIILTNLDHPYIARTIEIFEDEKRLYVVQEKPRGGLLFDKIMNMEDFSEQKAAKILFQVLTAVKYLHANGIIHRDINPACIWFDDEEGTKVKLAGFGLSKILRKEVHLTEMLTHSYYSPPQVINDEVYTMAADMWGVGIVAYIMLSGTIPFDGDSDKKVRDAILECKLNFPRKHFASISASAKELIQNLLAFEEEQRLEVTEALEHPWFQEHMQHKEVGDESLKITLNHF
jgi:serine/threonine protein kinase